MMVFCRMLHTYILALCVLSTGCLAIKQGNIDYMGNSLNVKVKVVDNLKFDGRKHLFHVTLHNSGNEAIPNSDWMIYFCSYFLIESLPKEGGVVLDSEHIRLNHLTGCLFSIEPVPGFDEIKPNATKLLKFYGNNWAVSKTDIPPNWYVSAFGLQARLLKSTSLNTSNFVSDFVLSKQWKRYKKDVYNPFTPQERYKRYKINDLKKAGKPIVPTPEYIKMDERSHVDLTSGSWHIQSEQKFEKEAKFLSVKTGIGFGISNNSRTSPKTISLMSNETFCEEEYFLYINTKSDSITITGKTKPGIFYGIQSLLSLIDGYTMGKLPEAEVKDKPRFEYRGMHVDVSRNFHDKEDIKRLLEAMAMYKMNKFHFHLTDDEGWRIEIPGLPELTNMGSKRCHDVSEEQCLLPQLGSGPDTSTSGSGFYTTDDYIEIIKYANDRHIEVIPEIESPGHARAAIKAMELRYKNLKKQNSLNADLYRLVEPSDTSVYLSNQIYNDNSLNPCIENTYTFIEKVIDEIKSAHSKAGQPLKKFHFGGDEVPQGSWVNSTSCNALKVEGTSLSGREMYKQFFAQRLANITRNKGLVLVGWEDGLMDKDKNPYQRNLLGNNEIIANAWDNIWEWGSFKRAYALADSDYKVILSHASHLYYDHPYEPDPEERGLYWATRFTDTYKSFRYNAEDLYKNIDVRVSGQPISRLEVCKADGSECPTLKKRNNIIGMEGNLFSETALNKTFYDAMIFPRIFNLAERSWHKASWESIEDAESRNRESSTDWEAFANTIGYKEFHRLDKLNIEYRVPPPGAELQSGVLVTNSEFPGLKFEYSDDYRKSWKTLPANYKPKETTFLRTVSTDGNRRSREIKFVMPIDQHMLDYTADHLDVMFNVIDNFANGSDSFIQEVIFTNKGTEIIREGIWNIYLYHIRLVEPYNFPYPDGYLIPKSGLRIFHVGGSLYRLAPDPETFRSIRPSSNLVLRFKAKYWQVARTDSMPNWYIAADGFEPRIIRSTADDSMAFVGDFKSVNQWKRYSGDKYDPFEPQTRYAYNNNIKDLGRPGKPLIPTPVKMNIEESVKIPIKTEKWVIIKSKDFPNAVEYLKERTNLSVTTAQPLESFIHFVKDDVRIKEMPPSNEAYHLRINESSITVTSGHSSGAFYAIQSLLRLCEKRYNTIEVPKVEIYDQPRFTYRGMFLDVGRNFHTLEEIKLLLQVMSSYKLNKLHLHLSEDEGWRIQIPGLQELTEVGSKRCHDVGEKICTLPQLGSGPFTNTSGSGFYTVEDYKEILREAKKLHIQVIPEIDMPGHARAAIKSMQYRYRKYRKAGNMTLANEYLLSEMDDPSEYLSVQWFNDNAINPCLESAYTFVQHLIKHFKDMHKDIQPLSIYHFGGDEVAHGAWIQSSACKRLMNSSYTLNNVADLKEYFAERVGSIASKENVDIGAWEDGLMKTKVDPYDVESIAKNPRNVYAYSWRNLFQSGSGDHAYVLANAGYKVILAHATHLYFDHPYEPDPEERGYYWATRYTDTFKTFSFVPDNIFVNNHLTTSGEELKPEQICKDKCLKLQKPENILGIQGQLWSETSRTSEQLQYMIFPRLLALAERAWHKADWENIFDRNDRMNAATKDFENFANALGYKDLRLLDNMGIKYRIPPPGAIVENNQLKVNSRFPGLSVEYSTDAGKSWKSAKQDQTIDIASRTIQLRTRSADKARRSRVVLSFHQTSVSFASSIHFNDIFLFVLISIIFILKQ